MLQAQNAKAAEALADPSEYPNLFPDLEVRPCRPHAGPMHVPCSVHEVG